jgi:hypothetical protein
MAMITRTDVRRALSGAGLVLSMAGAGCDDGPTSPHGRAVATVGVGDETFRVELVDAGQVAAARAAQAGGRANIPNARIVPGTGVNVGWSWHVEDVEFVEAAVELCDGRPSDVERQGTEFGGGRFCPWTARMLAISGD